MKKVFFAVLLLFVLSFMFTPVTSAGGNSGVDSGDSNAAQVDSIRIDAALADAKDGLATTGNEDEDSAFGSSSIMTVTPATVTPLLKLSALPRGSLILPGFITLTATISGAAPSDSNKTITFNVNGETNPVITNSSGTAIFTIYNPVAGEYDFIASFKRDADNEEAEATLTDYIVKSPENDVVSILESRYGYLAASILLLIMLVSFAKNRKNNEQ